MAHVDIAVAIISYNTQDLLKICINSILKSPPLASYEMIVVDNGSADGSPEMMKRDFPNIHLLENSGNLGYAAAANQALRTSRAKYVLILNTDIEADVDALDILFEHAEQHDDLAVVGPLLLNTDGTIQPSGRHFPSFLDATMHAFLGHIWPRNPFSVRYRMLDWDRKNDTIVDWVSGAAMLIRREAAEGVGLFDEGYFMYVEDMDLCYKLWKSDWKVYFCPDAKMVHHVARSSEQSSVKMIIEFQRSLYRFFDKTYSETNKRWLKPVVAAGLVLRGAALIALDWVRRRRNQGGAAKDGGSTPGTVNAPEADERPVSDTRPSDQ